ncbi:MAG TPA: tetratricopeptide repeat protein [Actinomycetota bacterium]|nr:tetratricopeptide repeat protein [Actinomycetota bacterium]
MDRAALLPYAPPLAHGWPGPVPGRREIAGSMAFVDVSGFTKMSERLARRGKVGAEEVAGVIDRCFSALLGVAHAEGGQLLKFGGDALLLFFSGEEHERRAARATASMRRTLRSMARIPTSAGAVTLRMSVGVHAGSFTFSMVGRSHRELVVSGPAATRTVEMESAAAAGQILLSPELASALPRVHRGRALGPGILLAGLPTVTRTPPSAAAGDGTAAERLVPAAIRDHVLAGGGESEHRLVSIAFLHFGGIDGLPADEALARLHEVIGEVQRIAQDHDVTFLGTDIDRDGGKIILVAGAPATFPDDEGRLLRTVRAVLDAGLPLPLRAGVNRGHVFSGDIGPPERRTYTVMGDAVNLAARLMQHAHDGEIVVAPEVVERARTGFEVEPLEPLVVKGKARPVEALRLGAAHTRERRQDRGATPLIGREAELATLLEAVDDARAGRTRVVEIVADAGLGKSRLVEEVARRSGLQTLRGGCDPYEAATPYFPFRTGLRTLLGIDEGAPEREAIARLRSAVTEHAPSLLPWLSLIAAPLGLSVADSREVADLDEAFRRTKLHTVVAEVIAEIVGGPLILLIEDAHWIDDASADLLRSLAAETERPWLICVTRRGGDDPLGLDAEATTRLELVPLGGDASAALLAAATEDAPLHPHETRALAERAGGNPLFLAELLRARAAGEGGDAEDLPDTVESAIAARIDRLPPRERDTLRRLSVLGPTFGIDLVEAVVETPETASVERLKGFISPLDGRTLRFEHALIRDVAYERLPYKLRRELHARVAERIERAAFPDLDNHAEALALHFSEAGNAASAWIYARVAGRRAQTMYANVEAARFYERALRAARSLDVPDEVVADLWESLGDVRARVGEFTAATAAYGRARRLHGSDVLAQANLLRKEAEVARRAGRFTDALRRLARGRGALAAVEGPEAARERARLSAWYASVRQEQGRSSDAVEWCHRAIEEAEPAGADDVLAHASYLLDWAHVLEGRLDLATNSERALEIFERLGDLGGQANVLNNLGGFAYERGRWDEALAYYERARAVREKTGDAVNAAFGTINIGEILIDQGRFEEAERRVRDGLRVWRAAGYRSGVGFALMLLGRVAAGLGRHVEALEHLDEARREFAYVGAAHDVVGVDARVAEVRLQMGDAAGAIELAEDARTRLASIRPAAVHRPVILRVLGLARLADGDADGASQALEEALAAARAAEREHEAALTLLALATLAESAGDAARAASLREEAAPTLERAGVRPPAGSTIP